MNNKRTSHDSASTRRGLVTLASALIASGGLIPSLSFAAVVAGRTAGSLEVSNTGAATYTIPIFVPPGVGGVQPGLALQYNSSASNGLLGVGWQLAGFPSITRCGRTLVQDGVVGSPQLDANDRFCIDGERLRLTGGSAYGAAGSTYETELAEFQKFTAQGTAGSGPAWFQVKTPNGLTYQYGNSSDSAILASGSSSVRLWALNRVEDSNGNVMTYTYANDVTNGSYRPQSIQYTYTAAAPTTANYQVVFTYQSRSSQDGLWSYTIGGKNNELNFLSKIQANYWNGTAWVPVRSYALAYSPSPTTSRTRLNSIQECANTDCFAPTTVSYQDGETGWGNEIAVSGNMSLGAILPIDFTGDGIDDLVYPDAGTGRWSYQIGTASGAFQGPYDTGIANTNHASAVAMDYNADGKDDVLVPNAGSWYVMSFQSAGASFAFATTNTPVATSGAGRVLAGDVNGDGREDLIYAVQNGCATCWTVQDFIYYRLSSAGGFGVQTVLYATQTIEGGLGHKLAATPLASNATRYRSRVRAPDFNGDGRIDFSVALRQCIVPDTGQCQPTNLTISVWSRSDGTYGNSNVGSVGSLNADFNGDGCSDYLTGNTAVYGSCYRAGGSITGASTAAPAVNGIAAVVDWDGDGRDDLLQFSFVTSTWGYQRSNGSTIAAWVNLNMPFSGQPTVFYIADVNGDGLDDFLYGVSGQLRLRLHKGVKPDLATNFTDANGNSVNPAYTALTQGNYTKESGASFPERDYLGPMYVVSSVTASNGIGGTFTRSFWYYGARMHLSGRGFEGFREKRTLDSRNNLYLHQFFRRDFPYIGLMSKQELRQPDDSTLIGSAENTFISADLDTTANNQRHFPHIATSTVKRYEPDGARKGTLIATGATTYTFDNSGNATNVATTLTDNDGLSPFSGQQWATTIAKTISPQPGCLGLPTRVTVTNTAPGGSPMTRTTDFIPDYANCRMSQSISEPGSPTYKVTHELFYDGFGNLNREKVTGIGMTPRETTLNYLDAKGQFPASITNAANETTEFGYDFALGLLTSQTDPNELTVAFGYDQFGRPTSQLRPDGTSTTWSYANCSPSCVNSNNRTTVTRLERGVPSSTIINTQVSYLDQLDRALVATQQLLGGSSQVEMQYNALGRLFRQSMPCDVAGCTQYWNTHTYDIVNRLTKQERQVKEGVSTLQSTRIAYDGHKTTITDALEKTSTRITTVAGMLGRSADHSGHYQNFTYDAFGSLLSVTDSLSNSLFSATYDYGEGAYQRTVSDMDLGTRSFTFNALGELTNALDGKGQPFLFTYDALSRLRTRTEPEGTATFTYGGLTEEHNIGQLVSMSSPGYSEQYTYDERGRLSRRRINSDAQYDYDYSYDGATGLLHTLTYPTTTGSTRLKLEYGYQNGILQQVKDFNSSTVFWLTNTLNPRGQVTQETLGNGIITKRFFDAVTGRLSEIRSGTSSNEAAVQNESYLYDFVGNLTQRQNGNLTLTENFFYDDLHRLDFSTLGSTTNLNLAYDAMGNITSRSDVAGGATWTYHATKKHAVVQAGSSSFTYSYDANGNAQTRNGYALDWTSYNYPSVIRGPNKTMAFSYGPDRQRFKQIYTNGSNTETTMYIGGLLEKVTENGVTDWRHYVAGGSGTVAVVSRKSTGVNTTRYLLEDHQGSVSQILDSSGAIYVSENFTAFGARRDASTWSGACPCPDLTKIKDTTRRGYTGHEAIGGVSMGLNHMNGRVQDAITGRFLSPDPYVQAPGFTQSFNRYSYTFNNPLSYVDPSGFDADGGGADGNKVYTITVDFWGVGNPGRSISAALSRRARNLHPTWFSDPHRQAGDDSSVGVDPGDGDDGGGGGGGDTPPSPPPGDHLERQTGTNLVAGSTAGRPTIQEFGEHTRQNIAELEALLAMGDGTTPRPPSTYYSDLANNWWPGYSLGTCIREGCSGLKWAMAGFSIWPGSKAVRIGRNWAARDIADVACERGCEAIARQIQLHIGGDIVRIAPQGAPMLGAFRGKNWGWGYHEVVVKNGRVYDITTGHQGLSIEEYKKLWQYSDAINFGF